MKLLIPLLALVLSTQSAFAAELAQQDLDTLAAAKLEGSADRSLLFWGFDSITMGRLSHSFTWEEVRPFLLDEKHKDLLVIRLAKGRYSKFLIEDLRALYRGLGYKRVLVIGSTAFSNPIYADDYFDVDQPRLPHVIVVPAAYSPPYLMILPAGPLHDRLRLSGASHSDGPDVMFEKGDAADELENRADRRLYVHGVDSIETNIYNPRTGDLKFTREELRPLLLRDSGDLLVIRVTKGLDSNVLKKLRSLYSGLRYRRVIVLGSSAFATPVLEDVVTCPLPPTDTSMSEALSTLDMLPRGSRAIILPAASAPPFIMILNSGPARAKWY